MDIHHRGKITAVQLEKILTQRSFGSRMAAGYFDYFEVIAMPSFTPRMDWDPRKARDATRALDFTGDNSATCLQVCRKCHIKWLRIKILDGIVSSSLPAKGPFFRVLSSAPCQQYMKPKELQLFNAWTTCWKQPWYALIFFPLSLSLTLGKDLSNVQIGGVVAESHLQKAWSWGSMPAVHGCIE